MRPALPVHDSRGNQQPIGALAGLSLLLVDDSADTLGTMAMLLELEGASVACAASGEEAVALAAAAPFDIIVSDVGMPRMDGCQMLRSIRADAVNRHTPAIALTGYAEGADIGQFDHHLLKPVEFCTLIESIVRVSGSR